MNERVTFVAAMLEEEESFSDLHALLRINRKQGDGSGGVEGARGIGLQ
jgi:hypothetical protein